MKLKQSDALNFNDIVDRGDVQMPIKEHWIHQYTVKKLTNLALRHPDKPWRIFRVEDDLWYTFDKLAEEWVSDEGEK